MHFYSTSAQIASDFNVEHDKVLEVIEKMPHSEFREKNIQTFDLGEFKIAQMTEPGYNATVFYLPRNEDNEDKLIKFREMLFQNRAPVVTENGLPASTTNAEDGAPPKIGFGGPAARKEAEERISAGEMDQYISESFAQIHRRMREGMNADPGYQNVRAYVIARRGALGVTV